MIEQRRMFACVLLLACACTAAIRAQEKPSDANANPTTPIKLQVVISRYEGEKKISSLPYVLSTNVGVDATIRVGTLVPVAATSYTPIAAGGAGVNPLTSYQYRDIGTNIDCKTASIGDGRFRVVLTIEDSSVYPEDQRPPSRSDIPSFRSFRAANSLVLKDGQTSQLTTAVDKMTGIVTKVDVTLNVVK